MDADRIATCRAWATAPNRKWQTLNRAQWKYQFHEKTLVRYVEEASMDESIVPFILEWLASDDCKDYLQLYGQLVEGEWTPIRAWYEISNKSVGSVRSVRLYHALTSEPNIPGDVHLVEDGCAYRVTWTNYWRQESVPDATPSQSGVSYRTTNLQRDPDTGLYSYTVERRERVQQDIEEYLVRTTQFEDQGEEVHLGVRGDLGAGGKQASVSNGRTVTRKVTKNSDCTHDVHNTITQDKAVPEAEVTVQVGVRGTVVTTVNRNMPAPASTDGLEPGESVRNQKTDSKLWNQTIRTHVKGALVKLAEACSATIFAHRHSNTKVQSDDPGFSHAADAGGGKIHTQSVSRTSSGSYRIEESEVTEKPVGDAVVSERMTLAGLTRSVTHRNQTSPGATPTKVGEGVTNRKTDGGRYDVTLTEEGALGVGKTGEACSRDAFTHHHSVTNNEKEAVDPETAFETGRIVRKSSSLTGNGTANNTTDTTTAVPQINKYTYTRADGAVVHVIQYKNQSGIPSYPDGAEGLSVHDSLNAFKLHDGSIAYLTNAPYKVSIGDLKFIKHGPSVKFHTVGWSKRHRAFRHKEWTVQVHHIRGDAYTDYLSDEMSADIARTTQGILCTKLLSTWRDRDGNLLAEWKWVQLTTPPGDAWVVCTSGCKHNLEVTTWDQVQRMARSLLAGGEAAIGRGADAQDATNASRENAIMLAAALSGRTPAEQRALWAEAERNWAAARKEGR